MCPNRRKAVSFKFSIGQFDKARDIFPLGRSFHQIEVQAASILAEIGVAVICIGEIAVEQIDDLMSGGIFAYFTGVFQGEIVRIERNFVRQGLWFLRTGGKGEQEDEREKREKESVSLLSNHSFCIRTAVIPRSASSAFYLMEG